MTIERLEEIKNTLYEALHYQENFRNLLAEEQMEIDVNKLIDAEIERQSVTDEEMQDAIAWLKSMSELGYKPTADKAKIALQALQLFGKSEEPKDPCEWCSGEQRLVCYKVISPTTRVLVSKTNYCPNCGRKL